MNETGEHALRMLFWESTARCNLACRHCRRLTTTPNAAAGELTTDEVRRVFDSAAALGNPVVVFSGGEPLMRDDWDELANYAGSLELLTALATNGTLIDRAMAERIAAGGFRRVSVSLDAPDAATHDDFRGIDGAFERAVSGIAALNEREMAVQINVTVAAHNDGKLDEMYDLARSLNAVALHLFLLVPVGCGVEIGPSHQLSPRRYEEVLVWICDRQAEGGLEIRATCAPHYYRIAAQRGVSPDRSRGCLCGLSVVFVSHTGEVFPCGYLPVSCGSVRDKPLAEIWRTSEVMGELRDFDRLKGKCGRCEYKAICGGCRARSFAAVADYLAAEPSCAYEPKPTRS